jgi:hypothetical protein
MASSNALRYVFRQFQFPHVLMKLLKCGADATGRAAIIGIGRAEKLYIFEYVVAYIPPKAPMPGAGFCFRRENQSLAATGIIILR